MSIDPNAAIAVITAVLGGGGAGSYVAYKRVRLLGRAEVDSITTKTMAEVAAQLRADKKELRHELTEERRMRAELENKIDLVEARYEKMRTSFEERYTALQHDFDALEDEIRHLRQHDGEV